MLTYAVRGGDQTRRAFDQLVAALARGDGSPVIDGAEKVAEARQQHNGPPTVGDGKGVSG